jgi:hypothetical protein
VSLGLPVFARFIKKRQPCHSGEHHERVFTSAEFTALDFIIGAIVDLPTVIVNKAAIELLASRKVIAGTPVV